MKILLFFDIITKTSNRSDNFSVQCVIDLGVITVEIRITVTNDIDSRWLNSIAGRCTSYIRCAIFDSFKLCSALPTFTSITFAIQWSCPRNASKTQYIWRICPRKTGFISVIRWRRMLVQLFLLWWLGNEPQPSLSISAPIWVSTQISRVDYTVIVIIWRSYIWVIGGRARYSNSSSLFSAKAL